MKTFLHHLLATSFFLLPLSLAAHTKKLKVFILAGQSNMEGPANVSTFDYIGDDPATAPLLKMMRGSDGKAATSDGAWISYLTGANDQNFDLHGPLTAGYGLMWEKHPQGAHGIPKAEDRPKWNADKVAATGVYYRLMMDHVKKVLADPKNVIPTYDAAQGFELAGFVWLQGFNDMVDGPVYPRHNQPDRYAAYTDLLATFIRDVRKDLKAPKLPFVIGVMGVGGLGDQSSEMVAFRKAMAAPAAMEEFKGGVLAEKTAPFWSDELGAIDQKRGKINQMRYFLDSKHKDHANANGQMSQEEKNAYLKRYEAELISPAEEALWKRGASNAGYHYLGCAKTFALMGKHFAEANLSLLREQSKR